MLKRFFFAVALLFVFSLPGSFAEAEGEAVDTAGSTLSNIPVSIESASFFQTGDQLHFVAMLRNESSRDLVVRSGVEFHPVVKEFAASQAVYTEGAPTVLAIPAGQTVKQEFAIVTPGVPVGQYRVYIGVAEDKMTRSVVKKSIATLELGAEHAVALTDCKMGEQSWADGILEVSPQNGRLTGAITCQVALTGGEGQAGHVLVRLQDRQYVAGTELTKAAVNFTVQAQSITLPFDVEAEPGSYDVEVLPVNTDGRVIGVALRTRLVIAGLGGNVPIPTQATPSQQDQPFNWWMIFWLLPVVFVVFWLAVRRVRQARITGIKTLLYLFMFLGMSFGMTSQAQAGSANFNLFYICGMGPCPLATAVWYNFDTDKSVFAPGELIYVNLHISSDDNPQTPLSPYVSVGINGGNYSGDLIPTTYQPQDFRSGVDIYGGVAVAPATPGPFNLSLSVGLSGYASPGVQNIPLTVSVPTPPPTVTLNPFSPSTITAGQTSSISFSSTNATSCVGDTSSLWAGNLGSLGATVNTPPMNTVGTFQQSITCNGPGGSATSATRELRVNAPALPTASFTGGPPCVIAANQSGCNTTVSWTASNVGTVVLTNCLSASMARSDVLLTTITSSGPGSFNPVYVPYKRGCYRIHNNDVNGPILAETTISSSCTSGTSWVGLVDSNGDPTQPGSCQGAAPTAIITATGPVAFESKSLWQKALSFVTGRDYVARASGAAANITVGQNARINWDSNNVDTCSIRNQNGISIGVITANNADNRRLTGLAQGTHTYTITCQKAGFANVTDSVNIIVSAAVGSAPSTPAGLSAVPDACGTRTINVNWSDVAGATSYDIEVDGGSVVNTGATSFYAHTGLSSQSVHSYRVRARNATGPSAWSGSDSATAPAACVATTYSITSSVGGAGGGSISPSGTESNIPGGASRSFVISPVVGYVISDVSVATGAGPFISVGTPSGHTFSNISANHQIRATFSGAPPCVPEFTPQMNSCMAVAGVMNGSVIDVPADQTYGIANYTMNTCTGAMTYTGGCSVPPACLPTATTITQSCAAVAGIYPGLPATHTSGTATLTLMSCGTLQYTGGCSEPLCSDVISQWTIACGEVSGRYGIPANYTVGTARMNLLNCGGVSVYAGGCSPTVGGQYTITTNAGPGGNIVFGQGLPSVGGVATVWSGTSVYVGAMPLPGYVVDTVVRDGVNITPLPTGWTAYFPNVTANHTVDVTFRVGTASADFVLGTCTIPTGQSTCVAPISWTSTDTTDPAFPISVKQDGVMFGWLANLAENPAVFGPWNSNRRTIRHSAAGGSTFTFEYGPGNVLATKVAGATCSDFNAVWDSTTATCIAACVPNNTCANYATEIANTCVGSDYVIANNGCNATERCPGTRSCDYNWKEVSP